MTNNLKCPFCGAELENEMALFCGFESETGRMLCSNQKCMWHQQTLELDVWQALIDGKKAQEALVNIVDEIDRALYANHYNDKIGVRKVLKDLRASIE